MASRQPERYIPHVRNIFQIPSNENRLEIDKRLWMTSDVRKHPPSSEDHSDEEHYDYDGRLKQRGCIQNRNDQQYGNYGRTLTEKDLKHIERHLSMKKTIRKQLSRHLTQAFVDSESNLKSEKQNGDNKSGGGGGGDSSCMKNEKNNGNTKHSYNMTLTQSNVAKSESNFLDLLKEVRDNDDVVGDGGDGGGYGNGIGIGGGDGDSGHCSPIGDLDVLQSQWPKNYEKKNGLKNNAIKNGAKGGGGGGDSSNVHQENTKSSFWKKLTIRVKSKR